MTAGQRLRILRTLEGWSQAQVADLLGLASQTLSSAEADQRVVLAQRAWKELAAIFGVHLEWLLNEQGPVFTPALRAYVLHAPSGQRIWRMIAEGFTTLGAPFLKAIRAHAVFRLEPGLAVLRLTDGWVLLDAPAFIKSWDGAFSEVRRVEDCSRMSLPAYLSPHEPRAVFDGLARHLGLSGKKVEALVQSWESWVSERDRWLRQKGVEGALQQIAELTGRHEIPIEQVTAYLRSALPRRR